MCTLALLMAPDTHTLSTPPQSSDWLWRPTPGRPKVCGGPRYTELWPDPSGWSCKTNLQNDPDCVGCSVKLNLENRRLWNPKGSLNPVKWLAGKETLQNDPECFERVVKLGPLCAQSQSVPHNQEHLILAISHTRNTQSCTCLPLLASSVDWLWRPPPRTVSRKTANLHSVSQSVSHDLRSHSDPDTSDGRHFRHRRTDSKDADASSDTRTRRSQDEGGSERSVGRSVAVSCSYWNGSATDQSAAAPYTPPLGEPVCDGETQWGVPYSAKLDTSVHALYRVAQKWRNFVRLITSSNTDQFSNFFPCQNRDKWYHH